MKWSAGCWQLFTPSWFCVCRPSSAPWVAATAWWRGWCSACRRLCTRVVDVPQRTNQKLGRSAGTRAVSVSERATTEQPVGLSALATPLHNIPLPTVIRLLCLGVQATCLPAAWRSRGSTASSQTASTTSVFKGKHSRWEFVKMLIHTEKWRHVWVVVLSVLRNLKVHCVKLSAFKWCERDSLLHFLLSGWSWILLHLNIIWSVAFKPYFDWF